MDQNQGTSKKGILLIVVALLLIIGGGAYLYASSRVDKSPEDKTTNQPTENKKADFSNITYRNKNYGFQFENLPAGWESYKIGTSNWAGSSGTSTKPTETGPIIILKNSKNSTSSEESWQDIPVMIFTLSQWEKDLITGAAPVPPTEMGRNNKYVFALPPRAIGFKATQGVKEVGEWLESKPLKTFEVK